LELRAEPRATLAANPQRQRNLRNQHDGRLAARKRVLNGAEIDLRLSASSDAMQQLHAELAEFESRANRVECRLLRFVERMRGRLVARMKRFFGWIDRFFPGSQHTFPQQSFDNSTRNMAEFSELRQRQRSAFVFEQCTQKLQLLRFGLGAGVSPLPSD